MKNHNISSLYYFKYFYKFLGNNIFIYIFLNILVGFLDGVGLTMFIPLLAIVMGENSTNDSSESLLFFTKNAENLGIEINLPMVLILMISLFTFKGIFYYIRIIFLTKLRFKMMSNLRLDLLNKLKSISYQGFTILDQGKVQNNMAVEINRLLTGFNFYFISVQHVVMLLTYLTLAFFSNWKFALMVGIGGALSNLIYKYINSNIKEYSKKQINVNHDFSGFLIQAVQNFKYLKATNYFEKYEKKLSDTIIKSEKLSYKISKISGFGESLKEPLIIIIISIVIVIQANYFGGNSPSVLASLLLIYRGLAHMVTLQNSWNLFVNYSTAIDSLEDMLSEFDEKKEILQSTPIENINQIKINNVSLSFGNKKVINNLSFIIPKNKTIAFIGESGAGKTTLANIICGLQKPDNGEILLDNLSLYNSDINTFRSKIGYITQEPVIFDDTIYNNVTFWAEKTPENLAKFNQTMETVSLSTFVNNLDLKEDANLGNNGVLISGGQKQRITIARELFKDIELLIMDEATSALDSETEKYIKENIDMLQGKYTMIIIAHRYSTIKNVDEIYLMDKGNIVQSGNFEQMYLFSDRFKYLTDLQKL